MSYCTIASDCMDHKARFRSKYVQSKPERRAGRFLKVNRAVSDAAGDDVGDTRSNLDLKDGEG